MESPRPQKPLELILARNLLTSISTPAFLVDAEASVVFYNEAAAALLGRSFEDAGKMTADEWTAAFGPLDRDGQPMDVDEIPITTAIRDGRPAHGEFWIRSANGSKPIEASAFPIVASEEGSSGAMILFWPPSDNGGGG